MTRRNDRSVRTDRAEPVRNRDRWTVRAIGAHGALTVTHDQGHGTVVLPADYARTHVRLGYAPTAHGNQGDTVDIGLTIVTPATSHRSLYVGATRGRAENTLLVVTDDPDQVRDVREQALTNERADQPAIARRRELLGQAPRPERADPEQSRAAAERLLRQVQQRAEPFLEPLWAAEADLDAAKRGRWAAERARASAPRWRRPLLNRQVAAASDAVTVAQDRYDMASADAAPALAEVQDAHTAVRRAEVTIDATRMRDQLDRLATRVPARHLGRDLGIGL